MRRLKINACMVLGISDYMLPAKRLALGVLEQT